MVLAVKLRASGKRLTPYVSSVQTNGKQQKAFAETYGKTVGGCVAANVKKGMGIGAIHDAVRRCAKGGR